jgi:hypothetical protein
LNAGAHSMYVTALNIYATNMCSTNVSLLQTLWHLTCHFGFPPPSDRRRILKIPIGHPPAEAAVHCCCMLYSIYCILFCFIVYIVCTLFLYCFVVLYIVLLHTLCFSLYVFMFYE